MLQNQFYLPDEVLPVAMKAECFAKERGAFWPDYDHSKFLEIMKEFENDPAKKMNQMSAGQLKKTYISLALACGCKNQKRISRMNDGFRLLRIERFKILKCHSSPSVRQFRRKTKGKRRIIRHIAAALNKYSIQINIT